ncbi:MAG: guanylate kinase [Lachnospiraceae bacterium]|nr:guanylate kinase [Lachnospiraceae bacterium]
MDEKKGNLIVISGFSLSVYGTVVSHIVSNSDNFYLSISATTKKKRDYEKEGEHYFFKTKEEFEDMIKNNDLLEYASYAGNFYGTPKSYVLDKLSKGENVILEIEQQGAFKVKEIYKDAILIFLTTDSFKTLYDRLDKRASETTDTLKKRFTMALREADNVSRYDYIVISDTVENTAKRIIDIATHNEKDKDEFSANLKIIKNIKEYLRRYLDV